MKQDNWTEQLRRKLADHEAAAPPDLWAGIEAALPDVSRRRASARSVVLRRWTLAAAFAAVATGGGIVWWQQYRQHDDTAPAPTGLHLAEAPIVPPAETPTDVVAEALLAEADVQPKKSLPSIAVPIRSQENGKQDEADTAPAATDANDHSAAGDDGGQNNRAVNEKQPETTVSPAKQTPEHHARGLYMGTGSSNRRNRQLSLGIYARGGLDDSQRSNAVLMAQNLATGYAGTSAQALSRQASIYLSGYEEQQHHAQPLSLGVSLSYPLTPRLSLASGVVVSRLHSEFTGQLRSQQYVREQTLYYVGVPLGLSYSLWQKGRLQVYAAANVQADLNVAAQTETEGVAQHLGHDRLQWSAGGAVGLQYALLPRLMLYAEPGVSHYFDNGSSVQNFYKDKPTSLRLQAGLRLGLR